MAFRRRSGEGGSGAVRARGFGLGFGFGVDFGRPATAGSGLSLSNDHAAHARKLLADLGWPQTPLELAPPSPNPGEGCAPRIELGPELVARLDAAA